MGDVSLGMTPNGSLYLGVAARNTDIHTASVDLATGRRSGEPERPIQRKIRANRTPQWSPDGTRLLFTSLGERAWQGRTLNILDMRTRQVRDVRTGLQECLVSPLVTRLGGRSSCRATRTASLGSTGSRWTQPT